MAKKAYVPPIGTRPNTPEFNARYPFARKCKGCKGSMKGEREDALWCKRCKHPRHRTISLSIQIRALRLARQC